MIVAFPEKLYLYNWYYYGSSYVTLCFVYAYYNVTYRFPYVMNFASHFDFEVPYLS